MRKTNETLYAMIFVGVMAAIVFVSTMFLRIQIQTPSGPTNLKLANIVCLLSGMLFGGVYGGLAAGIGSMLFDLTNPVFFTSAPTTLINFFVMGFVCGKIANLRGKNGVDMRQNLVAAVCGAGAYWLLYIGKSIIEYMILGNAFYPAVIAVSPKMLTSGINAVVAVVGSVILAKPLNVALSKSGALSRITKR